MSRPPAGPARVFRSRFLVVAFVALLSIAASITGFVWATQTAAAVVVDGTTYDFRTDAVDVSALLTEAGISVTKGDFIDPSLDTPLEDGITVIVRHTIPVTLVLGDKTLDIDVVGATVADALVAVGLDPTAGIEVSPAVDTPLEAGMSINVSDVFVRMLQEEVEIPFASTTVDDDEMLRGTQEVRTEGVVGRAIRIYEVVVTDGAEGARVLAAERIIVVPVDEVVAVGTKEPFVRQVPVSRGTDTREVPDPPEAGTERVVESTAYVPGIDCGYVTATGARAGFGVIAVDPSVIPLGTRLYIPGYGYGVAADTGGAIIGARIDVCFDTLAEALAWGRRTVTVTIVE